MTDTPEEPKVAAADPASPAGAAIPAQSTPSPDAEAKQASQAAASTETAARGGYGRALVDAVVNGNTVIVTILAILLAFVVGAVLMVISDQQTLSKFGYFFAAPSDSLSAAWQDISSGYTAMFQGAILDPSTLAGWQIAPVFRPICETLLNATPLIFGGLSVSYAFRAGLFNIGGQGQIIFGAICAGYVGFTFHLPHVIALIVAIAAGIIGGMFWGGIAGVLKAKTGAHEVITTIMLNYVALSFLGWIIYTKAFIQPNQVQPISKVVLPNARLPHIATRFQDLNFGLVLAIVAVVGFAWLLRRSTTGFRVRAVGANQDASRTAGISVPRAQIVAMLIAGGLMGMVGVCQVLGTANAVPTLTPDIDGGFGVDAITVALLGRTKPVGVVLASLLFGALHAGSALMQTVGIPSDIVEVIQALIVIFVAAPALVKEIFRLRGARAGDNQLAAKGWNG
jgi:simple sugar transport system permease protein